MAHITGAVDVQGYSIYLFWGSVPNPVKGLFPQFAISNSLRLSRMALRLAYLICSLGSSFAPFTGWRSFRPPKPRQGALSSVRNIKSAASLAHSASTCAFDLLTGLYIRAIHRMALIPAPLKPAIFLMNFHILLVSMTNKRLNGAPPPFR